jgi:hypothetical protein
MSSAGQQLVAGRIPGERIASGFLFSDSATITTSEVAVIEITAAVVSGRTYRITGDIGYQLSVATDTFNLRLRQGGTQEQLRILAPGVTASFQLGRAEGLFTAASTANVTVQVTLVRASGTGNITAKAASTAPGTLYVDYIEG